MSTDGKRLIVFGGPGAIAGPGGAVAVRRGPPAGADPWVLEVAAAEASEARIAEAVSAGAAAVLVPSSDPVDDLGRVAARLTVAEATAELPVGRTAVFLLASGPRALLALAALRPADDRLVGLGLDPAAVPAGPARVTAKGLVLLAAAAAAVPAFAAATPETVGGLKAEGFAAVLVGQSEG